ncbi:hypothetical protein AB0H20_09540 [Nocardia fluminea]|uniref:hypothetical protein n=1 Tax=Nocardia fluminea TaxID=134984 RepID=UPI003403C79D
MGLWDSIKNAPGKVVDLVFGDDEDEEGQAATPTPAENVSPHDMVGVGPDGKPLSGNSAPSQVVNPYDPTGELGITTYPGRQNSQADPNEIIGVGLDGGPSSVNGPASQAANPYDPTGELGITNYPGKSAELPLGGTSSTYTTQDYPKTSVPEDLASLAVPQTAPSEYHANSGLTPPSGVGTLGQLLLEISPPGTKFEGQTSAGADGSTTTEWNVVLPGQDPSYWGKTQHVPLADGLSVDINYGANGAPLLTEGEGEPALRLRLADENGAPRWAVLNSAGERIFTIDGDGNRIGGDPNYPRPGLLGIADKIIDDAFSWNPIAKGVNRVGFNALVGVGAMVGLWDDLPTSLALPTQKQAFEGLVDTGKGLLTEYLYLRGNAKDESGNTIYSPDGKHDQQQATLNFYNNVSKALIDTDWSQFSDKPLETLGSAGAGIALLVAPGPRGMSTLGKGAHLPEGFGGSGTPKTVPDLPWIKPVDPISPSIPEVLAPTIDPGRPNVLDMGTDSPRPHPNGRFVDPAGIGGPTLYDLTNPTFLGSPRPRPGDNIPRRGPNPGDHGGGNRTEQPLGQSEYAIPWNGRTEETPPNHWPVGVRERANDLYWMNILTGKSVKMPPWARNSPRKSEPSPSKPDQDRLEEQTTPSGPRVGIMPRGSGQSNWLDTTGLDSTGLGFFGDGLGHAKVRFQNQDSIAAGEHAKLPVPGGSPDDFFKPDDLVVNSDKTISLHEFKINGSPYRQSQFDGYSYYADGTKTLVIDPVLQPDLADKLRAAGVDPNNVRVSSVETTRWDSENVADDAVLKLAADTLFGDMVRGPKSNPEWRRSALEASSALNKMAAERSLNASQYFDALRYGARYQMLETIKIIDPNQQAFFDGLLEADQLVAGLFGHPPVERRDGGQVGGVRASSLSGILNFPSYIPLRARTLSGIRNKRSSNQSLTINIRSLSRDLWTAEAAEATQGAAHLAHIR